MEFGVLSDMLRLCRVRHSFAHDRTHFNVERKHHNMRALKQARKLIEKKPDTAAAKTLSGLVVALESDTPFALTSLYQLDYDDFELALDMIKEWRLDRYYSSKVRLLDLSVQVGEMAQGDKPAAGSKT